MSAPPVSSPPALLTLEEFAALPNADAPMELVRGEVIPLSPAHHPASTVAANALRLLILHVAPRRLGTVYGDNGGFALLGAVQTSRSPDVAFIRAERLPPGGIGPGPIRLAPDLAVEVLSPHESAAYLEEKLADYREAGTALIWVVYLTAFLASYRRQRRPSILITSGAGRGMGAHCFVTNLGLEPVYVLDIILDLTRPDGSRVRAVIRPTREILRIRTTTSPGGGPARGIAADG